MDRRLSRDVSNLLGIAATQDLGRYLGVPLLHGRVKHSTYDYILSRLDVKLAGWKANNLSLAGRVTLASSVLNAIPSYVMQTAFLPASICEGIDRKIRDFIWGSVDGARRIHNINWDTVCKPKKLGGLGLRSARELNKAFIMKIVWGLIDRPSELWAQVIISKYLKKTEGGYVLARKTGFSAVWRGMMKVWPNVIDGIQWSVRDGKTTKFWTDRWLDSGALLVDQALNIQGVNPSLLVSQVIKTNGDWDSDFLSSVLPHDIVLQVIGMSPPLDNLGQDSLVWGLEANGAFSVRSAYLMLSDIEPDSSDGFWSRIWRWKGPNKVMHFLWLASHKRLLTNEERGRRHLTNQVNCSRCAAVVESFEHVIFDCSFASQVWRQALPEAVVSRAELGNFDQWWKSMILDKQLGTKFGVIAWLIWQARNKFIFDQQDRPPSAIIEQCQFWTNLVLSSWKTFQLGREAPGLARQTQLIAWRPGDEGWFTLNTDGSRITQSGATAIGGIIRDSAGSLVRAFSANVGNCSITRAELRAIVEGLKLAWSLGIRKVAIQSDSAAAVTMLQASGRPTHRHAALVAEFQDIRDRQWEVSITHIFREANCCADYLANLGHSLWFGLHVFDYPVSLLSDWLRYDLIGVALPRVVSCND
ncbi:Putative ribonuclease H protein At1g65750 [Linum perenne]